MTLVCDVWLARDFLHRKGRPVDITPCTCCTHEGAEMSTDLRPLTETEIEDARWADAGWWHCPRCNGECACDQLDPAPDLIGNI